MKKSAAVSSPVTTKDVAHFRKSADSFVKAATKSQTTARRTLVTMGINTKSGKLTKNYKLLAHALSSSFVLGYHGCDRDVAEELLAGTIFGSVRMNTTGWVLEFTSGK